MFRFDPNVYMSLAAVVIGTVAAFIDIKYRKIPNWLTFPAMLSGIAINLILNFKNWHFPLLGLIVGYLILIIPFLLGGIGAGDVKLLMALGAFLGMRKIIVVGLYGGIAGGLLSLFVLLHQIGTMNVEFKLFSLVTSIWDKEMRGKMLTPGQRSKLTVPYGLAIYIGLLAGLLWGPFWG